MVGEEKPFICSVVQQILIECLGVQAVFHSLQQGPKQMPESSESFLPRRRMVDKKDLEWQSLLGRKRRERDMGTEVTV